MGEDHTLEGDYAFELYHFTRGVISKEEAAEIASEMVPRLKENGVTREVLLRYARDFAKGYLEGRQKVLDEMLPVIQKNYVAKLGHTEEEAEAFVRSLVESVSE